MKLLKLLKNLNRGEEITFKMSSEGDVMIERSATVDGHSHRHVVETAVGMICDNKKRANERLEGALKVSEHALRLCKGK